MVGPGLTHDYLEAMESFLPTPASRCTTTTSLAVGTPTSPTIPRYGPSDATPKKWKRFGAAWGWSTLCSTATPGVASWRLSMRSNYQQHLRGLVISNMTAGIQAYLKRTAALKKQLLPPEQAGSDFDALEAKQTTTIPNTERIMMDDLYPQMICRMQPWPEPVTRAFRQANEKIYDQMQGKSEFVVTGNLKDWERWDRLHEIKVKALTIGATHDEMDPDDMRENGDVDAERHLAPSAPMEAIWHVGRPAGILPWADSVFEIVVNQISGPSPLN